MSNNERLWWVTSDDRPIGSVLRKVADTEPSARHREVGIIVVRKSDKKVYFQKRSLYKKILPGWWSTGCAGHVSFGESARDAGIRELGEELHVDVTEDDLQFFGKELTTRPNEEHFKYWYVFEVDDDFNPILDPTEVADGKFLSLEEVKKMRVGEAKFYEPYLDIVNHYLTNDNSGLILEEEPNAKNNL